MSANLFAASVIWAVTAIVASGAWLYDPASAPPRLLAAVAALVCIGFVCGAAFGAAAYRLYRDTRIGVETSNRNVPIAYGAIWRHCSARSTVSPAHTGVVRLGIIGYCHQTARIAVVWLLVESAIWIALPHPFRVGLFLLAGVMILGVIKGLLRRVEVANDGVREIDWRGKTTHYSPDEWTVDCLNPYGFRLIRDARAADFPQWMYRDPVSELAIVYRQRAVQPSPSDA